MSTGDFNQLLSQAKLLGNEDQAELIAQLAALSDKKRNPLTESQKLASKENRPLGNAVELVADFWPEDENRDELTLAIRRLREQGSPRIPREQSAT